jgi:phospholipid/cholesterol/gamma-HCH transport system substrate-binding protein
MRRDAIETLVGALVLLGAAGLVYLGFASSGVRTVAGYSIEAEFTDVSGVNAGTEVRLAGVKIGTVLAKSLADDGQLAVLTLNLDEAYRIPADSKVRILPDGLLGGSYISLEPGGADEDLADGAYVTFDRTQGAVNVVDLLARFVVQAAEAGQPAPPQQ